MNLAQIEENVAGLDLSKGFELVYDLLRAYGIPKASISRLKSGSNNRSKIDGEVLWKNKLFYREIKAGEDLHLAIDEAKNDVRVMRERPRFLIIRDGLRLVAIDTKTETTLDIALSELSANSAFFLPWAGIEKTQLESINYADVKAAEKMARLYDEIVKYNEISSPAAVHDLNVFFSRLLFCFFAEDTAVFEKGSFTNAIASLTNPGGEDTGSFLDALFIVLDSAPSKRVDLPSHFKDFGYVNGKLFSRRISSPHFSAKARRLILECGTLDWSQINPDIFGSMIQAVVHPSQREGLGMHYTSVENIMKVIRPLFLDDLELALEAADSVSKLERLRKRIGLIKIFDPACGSGNFLVISYKELRKLEHRILERLALTQDAAGTQTDLFKWSTLRLENFYGIEIDDFAHEVAILSLWLAKHQMNVEFQERFGVEISLIPLRDTGNITCGNATRLDWNGVCAVSEGEEVYLLGNPPYRGAQLQTSDNKADLVAAFDGAPFDRGLDYVAAWYYKGARFVSEHDCQLGFVSTNSICQGSQVAALWPLILNMGVHISFAHNSFKWSNFARGKAGVTVVVIGLANTPRRGRKIFSEGGVREVVEISPYLTATRADLFVTGRSKPLSSLPPMNKGSGPTDGGALLLTEAERQEICAAFPQAARYIRGFAGASEFLHGRLRHCLWIKDEDVEAVRKIPPLQARLEQVAAFRTASPKLPTQKWAARPWEFAENRHQESPAIIVPSHSSERRTYVPMGFLGPTTVVSNAALVIYRAEPWVFGLIQSRMHMVWMRAVGGRIKSDPRYSPELVYNTFPVPEIKSEQREELTSLSYRVLEAREHYSNLTLAQLYDQKEMPELLQRSHRAVDAAVDALYRPKPFVSDDERLEVLFSMYEEMILAKGGGTHA